MNLIPRPGVTTLLLALLAPAACRSGETPPAAEAPQAEAGLPAVVARNRIRGVQRTPPLPKPDWQLTTTDGKPFDLRRDTRGYLTLVFFGYTHCPDVCPVHTANVAKVLKTLPIDVANRVKFVFVTTDPERDTPELLQRWLGGFHPDFIGVTGTPEQIKNAQLSLGLLPAGREVPDSANPSAYLVSHAAAVFAFTSDDSAHVLYPFGIRQQDWANDLPILVNGWPR
jgi:protein SCO1/2